MCRPRETIRTVSSWPPAEVFSWSPPDTGHTAKPWVVRSPSFQFCVRMLVIVDDLIFQAHRRPFRHRDKGLEPTVGARRDHEFELHLEVRIQFVTDEVAPRLMLEAFFHGEHAVVHLPAAVRDRGIRSVPSLEGMPIPQQFPAGFLSAAERVFGAGSAARSSEPPRNARSDATISFFTMGEILAEVRSERSPILGRADTAGCLAPTSSLRTRPTRREVAPRHRARVRSGQIPPQATNSTNDSFRKANTRGRLPTPQTRK